MSEPATTCLEVQDEVEEVSSDKPYLVEEPIMVTTSSGELAATPGTNTPVPAWPWVSGGQCNHTLYTPYSTQSAGLTNTAWQCARPPFSGWGPPYVPFALPAQTGTVANAGVWPYPSMPNTGDNTAILGALP